MKHPNAKHLFVAAALATMALSAPVALAHPPGKGHHKAAKHYDKAVRKAIKEEEKAYRRWARGQHIPRDYLVERYYVTDYRVYDLAPPPRGYRWVRPYPQDDTFYLVQLATGLVSEIFD